MLMEDDYFSFEHVLFKMPVGHLIDDIKRLDMSLAGN